MRRIDVLSSWRVSPGDQHFGFSEWEWETNGIHGTWSYWGVLIAPGKSNPNTHSLPSLEVVNKRLGQSAAAPSYIYASQQLQCPKMVGRGATAAVQIYGLTPNFSPSSSALLPAPTPECHSSCCTRQRARSWPAWGKRGWGWGWPACHPAGPPTPPRRWCSWRKSACVSGSCSSPPAGWASSSSPSWTSPLYSEWTGGNHWGGKGESSD